MRTPAVFGCCALLASCATAPRATPLTVPEGSTPYELRPGDVVRVTVWGQEQYSGEFPVDERGIMEYPPIGEVDVRQLTVTDLRDRVRQGLEAIFNRPFVTVTPLFRMAVLGQVARPGLYTVDRTLSVLDVVAMAGGATPSGNLNDVRLLRGGQEWTLGLRQAHTLAGRSLQEIGVRSGDQIIVPRRAFTRDDLMLLLTVVQISVSVVILANTFK